MKSSTSLHLLAFSLFAVAAISGRSAGPGLNHIGSSRQLSFDDAIVERMDNTKRRLNPAVKVLSNPVIKRDKSWEGPDMRIRMILFSMKSTA